jgi:hypothetical protein
MRVFQNQAEPKVFTLVRLTGARPPLDPPRPGVRRLDPPRQRADNRFGEQRRCPQISRGRLLCLGADRRSAAMCAIASLTIGWPDRAGSPAGPDWRRESRVWRQSPVSRLGADRPCARVRAGVRGDAGDVAGCVRERKSPSAAIPVPETAPASWERQCPFVPARVLSWPSQLPTGTPPLRALRSRC